MRRLFAVLLVPLAAGACVQSLNPLFTDDTLVAEPALLGTWIGESGDVLVVTAQDTLTYRMTSVDQDGEASVWIGQVTTLGGRRWLDVEPEPLPQLWNEEYRESFLPLHQFWVLQRVDSVLLVASLAYDSLKAVLDRDPAAVAHALVHGDVVLTAETPALRAFVAAFAGRPGHLDVGDRMRRVSTPP